MVLTFVFVSVILTAKYLNGAKDLFLNALIIGLTLFMCVTIGGKVSGGCFNPAVGLVQIVFQNFVKPQHGNPLQSWSYYWVYPVATWIGGALAGVFLHVNKGAQASLKQYLEIAPEDEKDLLAN